MARARRFMTHSAVYKQTLERGLTDNSHDEKVCNLVSPVMLRESHTGQSPCNFPAIFLLGERALRARIIAVDIGISREAAVGTDLAREVGEVDGHGRLEVEVPLVAADQAPQPAA